ncbi:penicillin-binding transpeptidase domain-containing protein [Lysobacter brunescens]|uniref:Beta-lactamase n=1 Tax=Lysobacter brunescens TaxID=262323 RepID=A0ABW2Y7J1_9GAMM
MSPSLFRTVMLRTVTLCTATFRTAALAALLCTGIALAVAPTAQAKPPAKTAATPSPAARFAAYGHPGSFLLQRDGKPVQVVHGGDRADTPLSPASTFKVLVALVALQTGTLRNGDEVVPWNGKRYPDRPQWERDMALREAMQTSSESFFGVLANRIGRERLATWVQRLQYGNGRIGEVPAQVWHDGVLTITARQQLDFIDRLRRGALPISPAHIATVKAAMDSGEIDGRRIYGKTGTHVDRDSGNAWWVGWVEAGRVEGGKAPAASFVLGIDLASTDERARSIALGKRIPLGKQLLRDAGALGGH